MDQVILFNKSFEDRLSEYKLVFSEEPLPLSKIQMEWAFYLDMVLEPKDWNAAWKINRETCEIFNIPYPSFVLVVILHVDFDDLTALVKVLAVQDEIHLPEKQYVPLIHLLPTKGQDQSGAVKTQLIANTLDMLRFFYENLVMPWDYFENESNSDWVKLHLESRLKLYYDIKTGVIPQTALKHLKAVLREAKDLQSERESITNKLEKIEEENADQVNQLIENYLRLTQLKFEVEMMENPVLRKAAMKRLETQNPLKHQMKRGVWMIHEETLAEKYLTFLERLKIEYPNEKIRIAHLVASALERGSSGDIYILNTTAHTISENGCTIENNAHIKGLDDKTNTVISSKLGPVLFDIKSGHVILQNLTINATTAHTAIIVRNASVTIKNCRIFGDGKLISQQGIMVLSGGRLEIIDSEISNFSTGIVGNIGAKIIVNTSDIHSASFGLQICDQCEVKISETSIRNCKCFGIYVETNSVQEQSIPKIGDFNILNMLPQVNLQSVKAVNNHRANAAINRKLPLELLENGFNNIDSNGIESTGTSDEDKCSL